MRQPGTVADELQADPEEVTDAGFLLRTLGSSLRIRRRWPGESLASSSPGSRNPRTESEIMSGTGWIITTSIIYLVLVFTLAVLTFRKGHWVLGLIGFVFPVLWLIGAILPSRLSLTELAGQRQLPAGPGPLSRPRGQRLFLLTRWSSPWRGSPAGAGSPRRSQRCP